MTTMVRCDQLNKYMGDKQMNKVDDSVSEGAFFLTSSPHLIVLFSQ